jgi:hypothetical protein
MLLIVACPSRDYEIPLPHGYFIARWQAGDFALISSDRHTVVVRNVKTFALHGDIVFGESADVGETAKFFIVDTKSNVVRDGLQAMRWESELDAMKVRDRELRRPNRTLAQPR